MPRLGQITTFLFISHLRIYRKEGEEQSLGWPAIHAQWLDAEPFSNVLRIKMKPYYLLCPLDSIISMEHQFISLCAVCGSHIWDFNNLHAVLWIYKQGQWRKNTTGLYFFIITLLKKKKRKKEILLHFCKSLLDNMGNVAATSILVTMEKNKLFMHCYLFFFRLFLTAILPSATPIISYGIVLAASVSWFLWNRHCSLAL